MFKASSEEYQVWGDTLNQPRVTSAIIGASKVHHVTDAVAISDWEWPKELLYDVKTVTAE